MIKIRIIILLILGLFVETISLSQWQSKAAYKGSEGKLVYTSDSIGNRIPDFSYAGYKNGNAPISTIAVVDSVSPLEGDNTSNIQTAINRVALRPLDINGFRGAILMKAGRRYWVSGMLNLNVSGVVLRGVGDGSDSLTNTIIYAIGDSVAQPTIVLAGGGNLDPSNNNAWSGKVGSNVNITSDSVHVGDKTFQVANASSFSVGDNIIIYHPDTTPWKRAVNWGDIYAGSNPLPTDTGKNSYWDNANLLIKYNRFITAIDYVSNSITIDVPVFTTLVRSLSQSYIYKTDRAGIITNVGIENFRIDINNPYNQSSKNDGDERHHAQNGIWLGKIEDAWVRHCTVLHFVTSGIKTSIALRVTIDSCTAVDPISILDGQRRYNLDADNASQLILFSNCYASYARHAYAVNGTSTASGIVFYNCISEKSFNPSEGHRLWSQGLLYDNYKDMNRSDSPTDRALGLYNRGDMGSGHGWASVHSVAWNCNVGTAAIIIQQPPTAQSYGIGCIAGQVSGASPPAPFKRPQGYIEGTNVAGINPLSLYKAQLADRLSGTSGIGRTHIFLPHRIYLEQNYPNPFNPSTVIRYQIPTSSNVQLAISDCLGRDVSVLVNQIQSGGEHQVEWNAARYPSGVYFCRLKSNGLIETRKLILMK